MGDPASPEDPGYQQVIADITGAVPRLSTSASIAATAAMADPRVRLAAMQFAESASDVTASTRLLLNTQRTAIAAIDNVVSDLWTQLGRPPLHWISAEQPPEAEEFRIVLKGWFFFARAFCDNAYRLLVAREQNIAAPRSGSMNAAIKATNPIGALLSELAPAFLTWFRSFRDVRNEIKEGVNFSIVRLDGGGLGVVLGTYRIDERPAIHLDLDSTRTVSVLEVREALTQLTALADVLRARWTEQA